MNRGLPALGAVLLFACGTTQPTGWSGGGSGGSGGGGGVEVSAVGPSHSSTLVEGPSNQLLAVNPLMDALITSRLDPGVPALVAARFPHGSQPSSVAVSPDGALVYVAQRGRGELWRLSNPQRGGAVLEHLVVGSEPVAVALTPRGELSVLAMAGEPTAVVIDNASGAVHRIELPGVTRAVAITNTGAADADEKAYVTLFFAGAGGEGSDTGREGLVAKLNLRTFTLERLIHLAPIADTGRAPDVQDGGSAANVSCFPNQLASILISEGRAYVAGICASPQPPLQPWTSAFAAVSVIDLSSDTEVKGVGGSATLVSLANQDPSSHATMFPNPVDLAIEAGTLYVLSQGSDRVAAISISNQSQGWAITGASVTLINPMCGYAGCVPALEDLDAGDGDPDAGTTPGNCGACDGCCQGSVCISASQVSSFACGLGGVACTVCGGSEGACTAGFCAPFAAAPVGVPMGMVVSQGTVVVNDLTGLQLTGGFSARGGIPFAPRPYGAPGHGGAPGHRVLQGVRFFSTALDRWSAQESLSCSTCHPDGRSDSVTWVFGAGPRQTVALDGTFAKTDPSDHRAQNWTAVADEIDDVEGLVRSTMRGAGALASGVPELPISLTAGISIDGRPVTRNDGLNGSSRLVSDELSAVKDWVQLEQLVQQVHTPAAPSGLDPFAVQRGRAVYAMAGCDSCHAGPKWTVSRVPYVPSPELNGSTVGDNGLPAVATGLRTVPRASSLPGLNFDTMEVATEHVANPDGGAELSVGPERITCVLRAVGTFDSSNPLEKKADGTRAQGALGFNVPSLLGVGTTAPYFHHGAAATLADVFSAPFVQHYQAGNPGFSPSVTQVQDLVTFLRSIDETTVPFAVQNDVCGQY